jgi:photosystem II stability/assembly factor-like uncharacterized protein
MKTFLFCLIFYVSVSNSQNWFEIESIPYGGGVYSIAVNSQNHFFGITLFGIYRSTDLGDNWDLVNSSLFSDPFNPVFPNKLVINSKDEIFLATQGGSAVYKSTDNGDTWNPSGNGISEGSVSTIFVDQNDDIFASTFNGPYRSTDDGVNWTLVNNGLTSFTSSFTAISEDEIFAGVSFNGIFKSTDNGETWNQFNGNGLTSTNITVLKFDSLNNLLHAGTGDSLLYVSTDNGSNWQRVDVPVPPDISSEKPKKQNRNEDRIVALEFLEDILYALSEAYIYYTKDIFTGIFILQNAVELSYYLDAVSYSPLLINKFSQKKISGNVGFLISTLFNGVYIYNETNGLEKKTKGIIGYIPYKILNIPGVALLIGTDSGLFIKKENELEYSQILLGVLPEDIVINDFELIATNSLNRVQAGNDLIFTAAGSGIYRSSDFGTTWDTLSNIFAWNICKDDSLNLYASTSSGIYFSSDMGENWESRNSGLINFFIRKIVYNENSNTLFCFSSNNDVYRSSDKGLNWESVTSTGLQSINDIIVNSEGGIFVASQNDGIVLSEDNGDSWQEVNSGLNLPYPGIMSIDSEDKIYAASSNKVYTSSDNGSTWQNTSSGLSSGFITSLYVDRDNTALVSLLGKGIYSTTPTTSAKTIKNIPSEYILLQNYPNPFNPVTEIEFSLPEESFIKLEIFNSIGEKISTLVSEYLSAGRFKYEWNAEGLPSGVYFYRLSANNFVQTKKLLLMK